MNILTMFGNIAYLISKFLPEDNDIPLKPLDSSGCLKCRNIRYDFIIVGGGTAGCVVANRLSENLNWNVLLIEAGGDEDSITDIPAMTLFLLPSKNNWHYKTVRQKYVCKFLGGFCVYSKGKIMGGSSTTNGMLFVRGHPQDYNTWEAMGNPGWGFKDVFPYFLKLENMGIPSLANSPYHSTMGPQNVSYSSYITEMDEDLLQAGIDYGLNYVDYNGPIQEGISYSQGALVNGKRTSTSKAYLNPIRVRRNLYIFKNTLVTKILFSSNSRTAIGVSCVTNGKHYNVYASKEVILSAGAINTPKLLMLSGVGPRDHLKDLNIPVYADLPVGHNLLEHPIVTMGFHLDQGQIKKPRLFSRKSIEDFTRYQTGPLSSPPHSVVAFLRTLNSTRPDIQYLSGFFTLPLIGLDITLGYISFINLVPTSVGSIKLPSSNYLDDPLIDLRLLEHPNDRELLRWGMRQAIKIMNLPSLTKYSPRWLSEIAPLCYLFPYLSDDFLDCYLQFYGIPCYHPVGTTKMGSPDDETTVVDPTLKVHGVENLRVVDASIMPALPRGNTMVPVIMIAEKASDIIINSYNTVY